MYMIVPVLVSRAYGEVEAREPGNERTTEEIESELEKLLAPYDASTRLEITRRSSGSRAERVHVPNYSARFDFWEPDGDFLGVVGNGEKGSRVEHEIYAGAGRRGHAVIAAGGLRTDFFYGALVTPDGRYHDFSPFEPSEEAAARREALLREHAECLAVVCKAHI